VLKEKREAPRVAGIRTRFSVVADQAAGEEDSQKEEGKRKKKAKPSSDV